MRYQIVNDDIGNYLILDDWDGHIVVKVRNAEVASKVCQKINKNHEKDKLATKKH